MVHLPASTRSHNQVPLFVLERMEGRNGAALDEAPGGGHRVRIPLPAGDYRFALLAKEL